MHVILARAVDSIAQGSRLSLILCKTSSQVSRISQT